MRSGGGGGEGGGVGMRQVWSGSSCVSQVNYMYIYMNKSRTTTP